MRLPKPPEYIQPEDETAVKVKVKLSRYLPWRHMGGEEV
jgi:hypothetical protein